MKRAPELNLYDGGTAMKKTIWLLGILLLLCQTGWAQERESLAKASRRVRAELAGKDLSKIPYYTNDNLPRSGAISLMGRPGGGSRVASGSSGGTAAGAASSAGAAEGAAADGGGESCDEQCWRDKFKEKRAAIKEAERELDILEREENLARRQHYTDPNQAMREQYSNSTAGGAELQDLQKKITDKKADVQKFQQELRQLEDDLRRANKPAGWGREQPQSR